MEIVIICLVELFYLFVLLMKSDCLLFCWFDMVNAKIEGISVILEIILTLIISLMILLYYMESSSDVSYLVVIFISLYLV